MAQPTLTTARLILRPCTRQDLFAMIQKGFYADVDPVTADHFASVTAESYQTRFRAGRALHFVIERRQDAALLGEVALILDPEEGAGLGYEIGEVYRNRGYATEAALEVVRYGLDALALDRIHATTSPTNPASIRVLEKVGRVYHSSKTVTEEGQIVFSFRRPHRLAHSLHR